MRISRTHLVVAALAALALLLAWRLAREEEVAPAPSLAPGSGATSPAGALLPRVPPAARSAASDPSSAPDREVAAGPAAPEVRTLLGRVHDAATGLALPGVSVERWTEDEGAWPPATSRRLDSVLTDGSGEFALPGGAVGSAYHVLFRLEGYGIRTQFDRPADGGRIDVGLRRVSPLLGVVLDPEGRPAAGARVTGRLGCSHAPRLAEAVADDRGLFTLPGLDPEAAVVVEVAQEGFLCPWTALRPEEHATEATRAEIRLERGNPFRARLVRGGVAAAGVRVVVPEHDGPDLRFVTGADGEVSFVDRAAEVELLAVLPGEQDTTTLGDLPSGETRTFDLDEARRARDRWKGNPDEGPGEPTEPGSEAAPEPLPGDFPVTLRLVFQDPGTKEPVWIAVEVTQPAGRPCAEDDKRRGDWRAPPRSKVRVRSAPGWRHTGYAPVDEVLGTGSAEEPASATIELRSSPRVRVRVLRPDGTPVSGADRVVGVVLLTEDVRREFPAADEGVLVVPVDAGFPGVLEVRSVAWPRARTTLPPVAADATPDPVTVRLAEPRSLRGSVRTPLGGVVPRAVVQFQPSEGPAEETACGEDGSFLFDRLPPGEGVLLAWATGYRASEAIPIRPEAGRQSLDVPPLRLRPPAAVSVVVLDEGGLPVAGCTVRAGDAVEARTDSSGRAVLRLGGARAEVSARIPGEDFRGIVDVDLTGPEESPSAEIRLRR